jgi:sterol desaturase/sphingolipid hydroxylase (fatty acid hydroxylase superfamily)
MKMPAEPAIDSAALETGRAINVRNAIVATLCGCGPAALLAYAHLPRPEMWLLGLVAGFIWANFFEYALHRWIMHVPGTYAFDGHLLHHASVGMSNEPLYVNLGGKAIYVVLMFVVNGGPVIIADRLLHWGFAPGVLVSFSLYFILTEEIHWRFHMGGWLPRWLDRARARHMAHHDRPDRDFAIFWFLFDRVFGTAS